MTDLTALLDALPPELRERLGPVEEYTRTFSVILNDPKWLFDGPTAMLPRDYADRALSACLNLLGERERMLREAMQRDCEWKVTDGEFVQWLADLRARAEAEKGQPVLMGDGDGYHGHDSSCACAACQTSALEEYPEG